MRFRGTAIAALLLCLPAVSPLARAEGINPDVLTGTVVSIGQAHSRQKSSSEGTSTFLDVNYIHVFLNGGVSYKHYDDHVANAYVGVGLSGLVQLQYGQGTEGGVTRIRTDINVTRMIDFFSNRQKNRYNQSFGSRLTFSFAGEEYHDEPRFDNFQAGVGLIF